MNNKYQIKSKKNKKDKQNKIKIKMNIYAKNAIKSLRKQIN